MRKHLKRAVLLLCCVGAFFALYAFSAHAAYTYPSMPDNWEDVKVTVGDVTMPFTRYPDGAYWDPNKDTMTAQEAADYGLSRSVNLRGWQCVAFARYAYVALFFKYPQDASLDLSLAYSYSDSYAIVNMIEQVLGTKTLASGYSTSTLKTLITSCRPGALMRVDGHSMVVMAIFDDGLLIYDGNWYANQVSVRKYTWQSFVDSFGRYTMDALQMPAYYPGYSYSTGGSQDGYDVDESTAGFYEVYNCSTLNVRTKPSTSSTVAGSLTSGTVVEVLGTYNGWAKIIYQQTWRWVSMTYLKPKAQEVTVTFDAAGGKASYTSKTYTIGEPFGDLPTATKAGRTFGGWSLGATVYDKNSKVPSLASLVLTARWEVCGYSDVIEGSWFASSVETAYACGLIAAADQFDPQGTATRGMMIAMLGRAYEYQVGTKLTSTGATGFSDIPAGSYYAPYVEWGVQNSIISGVGGNLFNPNGAVTREQIATAIYHYALQLGVLGNTSVDTSVLNSFRDASSLSSYARVPMAWCVKEGIFTGNDLNCLNPGGDATRAELVVLMVKITDYCETHLAGLVRVTFDVAGGVLNGSSSRTYKPGSALGALPTAQKTGMELLGWFNGDTQYTADSLVPAEGLKLTAKWCVRGYQDVREGVWYANAVERCYTYGMLESGTYFYPNAVTTRAEVVAMLGRAYELQHGSIGSPAAAPFLDVNQKASYAKYVNWAYASGIIAGYSKEAFGTDDPLTREQLAQILYRLAIYDGEVVEQTWANQLSRFSDGSRVSNYCRNAMNWAILATIFQGNGDMTLSPLENATHAQMAVLVTAYLDYADRNINQGVSKAALQAAPEAVVIVPEAEEPETPAEEPVEEPAAEPTEEPAAAPTEPEEIAPAAEPEETE